MQNKKVALKPIDTARKRTLHVCYLFFDLFHCYLIIFAFAWYEYALNEDDRLIEGPKNEDSTASRLLNKLSSWLFTSLIN